MERVECKEMQSTEAKDTGMQNIEMESKGTENTEVENAENQNEEGQTKEEHTIEFINDWMFRPCDLYYDEYKDCKSIKARFHQYFIFGELKNCAQWKKDYKNCEAYKKDRSKEAYNELVESEKIHRLERLKGHYENDIWEKRDKPPEDWNAPLPDWMQEYYKTTYLHARNEQLKHGNYDILKKGWCTIQ